MWLFTDIDECGEGIVFVSDPGSGPSSGSGSGSGSRSGFGSESGSGSGARALQGPGSGSGNNNFWCEQECINTVGSFLCDCRSGFSLDKNGQTCTGM